MAETLQPKVQQFLAHLRNNAREKLTTISKNTNIPISTLFDLLKELDGSIITKSTILLNFPELGYHTHAQVFLKVNGEKKDSLRKHLSLHSNVNTIYKVNNGWDFIIETIHHNIRELDQFLEELSIKYALEEKEIHYLVDEVKKEGFLIQT